MVAISEDKLNRIRVVPWKHSSELEKCYCLLFPACGGSSSVMVDDISNGLAMIRQWRIRGRIPVSVEATASLLEARLADIQSSIGDFEKRMLYSMAVTRFVNGLSDAQQKGAFSMPVAQIARNMDIPRFIVDIRHAATHDSLPSLQILREAVTTSLNWLDENYWKVQWTFADDMKSAVRHLLCTYKVLRKKKIKASDSTGTPLCSECTEILREIAEMVPDEIASGILGDVLLSEGFLIPLSKKKRPSSTNGLSADLVDLWGPLLSSLSFRWSSFLSDLLVVGLRILHEESKTCPPSGSSFVHTVMWWARYLIEESLSFKNSAQSSSSTISVILEYPTRFTSFLMESSVLADKKSGVLDAVKIASKLYGEAPTGDASLSLDDLELRVSKMRKLENHIIDMKVAQSTTADKIWSDAPQDLPWSQCPIGAYPG